MKLTKRETKSGGEGGGLFLRLGDGENVTGIFRGEVYEFWQSWPQGGVKQVYEVPTPGASSRFKANIIVKEGDKFIAKVFEFGTSFYNQLAELNEEYDLETTKVKISRRGAGKETNWIVMPLLKEPLQPKIIAMIEAVPLNELAPKAIVNYAPIPDDGLPF